MIAWNLSYFCISAVNIIRTKFHILQSDKGGPLIFLTLQNRYIYDFLVTLLMLKGLVQLPYSHFSIHR